MPAPDSIVLREAEPTPDEGLLFARYLDTAAEGFFRFWLGPRSDEILANAYTRPGHDLSFENVTFAERNGAIAGMISGYTAHQHRNASLKPLQQAVGTSRLRMTTIGFLLAPLFRILDTMGDDDYYLQAVAVDENARGQGLGTLLMDTIEERGRASHATRLSLHVSATNELARRLYERRGMEIESQWPKRLAIPGIRFFYMTKTL